MNGIAGSTASELVEAHFWNGQEAYKVEVLTYVDIIFCKNKKKNKNK